MKRTVTAVIAVALLAAMASATSAAPAPRHCTAASFRPFSAAVWRPERWQRGNPPASTVQVAHEREGCAPAPHRRVMKLTWREDRRAYFARRRVELFRQRVTPFYCGAADVTFDPGFYAIPCPNVDAESGGRGGPYCNTYGVIGGTDEPGASSPTWLIYGGTEFGGTACSATERGQSIVAHRVYRDVGTAAWSPFEG